MYIETKSTKAFIVILGIICISLIGFMINEQYDNLNSSEDRKQLHDAIDKLGDTGNDTKFLITWLTGLVKQSNATEVKQQNALAIHINMTHSDLQEIKKALKIPTT